MPYGLFPFVLLRGPLRESLVHVRALRLGGIPLRLGGWACLFGRPFFRGFALSGFTYFFGPFALFMAGIEP